MLTSRVPSCSRARQSRRLRSSLRREVRVCAHHLRRRLARPVLPITSMPTLGRIINNGSLAAHVPRPLSAPYTISKHAISGLTKATALEGRHFNIACTQIDIGNAATAMAADVDRLQPSGESIKEATMDVQHVADAVVHIASLPLEVTVLEMNIMCVRSVAGGFLANFEHSRFKGDRHAVYWARLMLWSVRRMFCSNDVVDISPGDLPQRLGQVKGYYCRKALSDLKGWKRRA